LANTYTKISIATGGGGGGTDEKIKISADDIAAGYLEDKIVSASASLLLATLDPGGNEQLELTIDASAIDHNALLNYEVDQHRVTDDAQTTTTTLWSSDKTQTELDTKIDKITSSTDNSLLKISGTAGVVEETGILVDDSDNVTGVNDLTVDNDLTVTGDLTVNGTTTTINTTTLEVTDPNITINDGGTQATADAADAGLTVEMSDATDAVIGYDSSMTSKFKVGEVGDLKEIATISDTQALTNKTIDGTDATGTNTVSIDADDATYNPAGNPETTATDVQAALDDTGTASQAAATAIADHIADATDAHAASAITNTPAGNLAATEVQAALNELQTDVDTRATSTELTNHEADTSTHGVTEIVGTSETQSLTNKTIDATSATGTNTVSMDAADVVYDNTTSGLTATDAQAAIDEVEARVGGVLVTGADTTEGNLSAKVVDGLGLVSSVLNPAANEQLEIQLGPHYLSIASTGLYSGAALSVGATTGTFDVSVGEGLYVDSTTAFPTVDVQTVDISARTNVVVTDILTQPVTYISIDKDDNIIQETSFPDPTDKRNSIFIGVVVHSDNVNVNVVNNLPDIALDVTAQIHDLMLGLGFFNMSGNQITPNNSNLSIDKSAGTAFKAGANFQINNKDPHTVTLGVKTLATFRYRNQDSSEGSDVTVLDPTTYDNAGVTTTVPSNNNATIQRVYIFPSNILRIQRGQEVFTNISDAVDAVGRESFLTEPNIQENGLLLASIVMKKTATDLSDSGEAQVFIASRFGELGSVGSSSVGNLQQTYDNSLNPEMIVDTTRGALTIRDNSTPIGAALFEVQNNAGSTDYLSVDVDGISLESGVKVDSILDDDTLSANSATALATQQSIKAYVDSKSSSGDLAEASFALAESASAASVTGLAFANGTVRAFEAMVSIEIDATADLFESATIRGIQKGSGWDIDVSSVGDNTLITFNINASGQITYDSSTYAGFVSGTIRFRAITTSV